MLVFPELAGFSTYFLILIGGKEALGGWIFWSAIANFDKFNKFFSYKPIFKPYILRFIAISAYLLVLNYK
jgi:hypothetical protein